MAIPNTYSDSVAAEVRATLARQRHSQEWLAAQTEIPLSTLNRRIRGVERWRVDEIALVALALGVDIHTLMPSLDEVA